MTLSSISLISPEDRRQKHGAYDDRDLPVLVALGKFFELKAEAPLMYDFDFLLGLAGARSLSRLQIDGVYPDPSWTSINVNGAIGIRLQCNGRDHVVQIGEICCHG